MDSAGTSGWHSGEEPDHRAIKEAKKNGIDISQQRSRKCYAYDFEEFDIIYAMDKSNYQTLFEAARTEEEKAKIKLIMDEIPNRVGEEVPDPYYNDQGFSIVFDMLEKACKQIILNHTNHTK